MDTHQHTAASLVRSEGKRGLSDEESEEEEYSSEALALEGYGGGEEYGGRRKRVMTDLYSSSNSKRGGSRAGGGSSGAAASMAPSCQVDGCDSDLSEAKQYHRRHKVCEYHAKAPSVHISGFQQRFCQQCSRFHELSEFDDSKRSCRRRLAGHNERRRKNATD